MPIYYKKVQRNSSDAVRFIDKKSRFAVGVKSKVAGSKLVEESTIELGSIGVNVESTSSSPLLESPASGFKSFDNITYEQVATKSGTLSIIHEGADFRKKPVIITYHDLGLNSISNFDNFFNSTENKLLLQSFAILHINAPGQEWNAPKLSESFPYPTMDQLAEQIQDVVSCFDIKSFIGFGSGVGANILLRFALENENMVDGLFLINPSCTQSSWTEWFNQRIQIRNLLNTNGSSLLPQSVQEYLLWYHFGKTPETRSENSKEIIDHYKSHFKGISINPFNLALFMESYIKRSNLGISRAKNGRKINCRILVMCGAYSPFSEDTIVTNSRLDPSNSSWIKLADAGMVLEEKPEKVSEAFRLFLQGLGYTLKAYERRRALMSGASLPCLTTAYSSDSKLNSRRLTIFE